MLKMKLSRKILLGILAIVIIGQFLRPQKNISPQLVTDEDISRTYAIPENVHKVLVDKCYDCHSNNTRYLWYYNIQPVGWWMAYHVSEGKKHLNFSAFRSYSEHRKTDKLEELSKSVTEGWMPLDNYLWMHKEAKVTPEETAAINQWITSLGVNINAEEEDDHEH
jgi:hypothetical protein